MESMGLTEAELVSLRETMKHADDVRVVRRSQALVWLGEGETVSAVARRQKVARQTVYRWIDWVQERRGAAADRLRDEGRSGRPPQKREAVARVIEATMGTDPRQLGYTSPAWTSALLREQVSRDQGLIVSQRTVTRALRGLGYRYKRPRHALSRRPRTWRQAKGGSTAA